MLTHPTLERLRSIRLHGMADAYAEQINHPDVDSFTFDERLGLLVDREASDRESRRLTNRLRRARLRQSASIECRGPRPFPSQGHEYSPPRGHEYSPVWVMSIPHLIDQDALKEAVADGEPWRYYDLGHGLCAVSVR